MSDFTGSDTSKENTGFEKMINTPRNNLNTIASTLRLKNKFTFNTYRKKIIKPSPLMGLIFRVTLFY